MSNTPIQSHVAAISTPKADTLKSTDEILAVAMKSLMPLNNKSFFTLNDAEILAKQPSLLLPEEEMRTPARKLENHGDLNDLFSSIERLVVDMAAANIINTQLSVTCHKNDLKSFGINPEPIAQAIQKALNEERARSK